MDQSNPYIGAMILFAGNFAPRGWAFCEGQLLSIASNTALFSILGTTYGGDGRTTFALPDLRGRGPISPGTGPGLPTYRLGERGGQTRTQLNILTMPSHNHTAQASTTGNISVGLNGDPSDSSVGDEGTIAAGNVNEEDPSGNLGSVTSSFATSVTVGQQGGSQSHNNMQPFLAINYIIALQGLFPSRS